jgi:hypothetical protein
LVDGQNLVQRLSLSLHLPGNIGLPGDTGTPASTRFTEATDFCDFGVPVRVSAPPAA